MTVGPAAVLALLVGIFHVSLLALIRGRVVANPAVLVLAAALGAWAGDAVDVRLGIDPLRIGDFHLLAASALAWAGIVVVVLIAELGPRAGTRAGAAAPAASEESRPAPDAVAPGAAPARRPTGRDEDAR